MTLFNVARINLCTEVEGPYRRLAIWFQGCDIRCPGCSNESMQPLVPAHLMSLEKLVSVISEAVAKFNIEGVTYLGGEPTLQRSLPLLSKSIHDIGLGVIAFTGRKFEDVVTILEGCDLVIDGPMLNTYVAFIGGLSAHPTNALFIFLRGIHRVRNGLTLHMTRH